MTRPPSPTETAGPALITAGLLYASDFSRMGTASNRLKVVCQGNRFQFFVNGQALGK
jgi:hypothetical protein